jgi:hypothetical protein
MDPLTMLAALGPLAVDLGKALIGRFINADGYKPANIAEWLQMRASDVDMFKAMNEAGGAGQSYLWVEAVVRLQRPAVAGVALLVWAYAHTVGGMDAAAVASVDNFAGAVGFYLFGDRTLFYARKRGS